MTPHLLFKKKYLHHLSILKEKARIAQEANDKRSEKVKEQTRLSDGKFMPLVGQNDPLPAIQKSVTEPEKHKARTTKSDLAKVNPSIKLGSKHLDHFRHLK